MSDRGCLGAGCILRAEAGGMVAGVCTCLPRELCPEDRVRLRREITAQRDELREARGEAGRLRAEVERLRAEKADLRTRVDVLGDTSQRIANAWNQIAGHFRVSPSPANAERIARLACVAADVRDEASATRDEACEAYLKADAEVRRHAERIAELESALRGCESDIRDWIETTGTVVPHYEPALVRVRRALDGGSR